MFDPQHFITDRLRAIDASGIRRVFDLAAGLSDPINLAIGQPDFDVPDAVKAAAIDAIEKGFNGYTVTQGIEPLRRRVTELICNELPNWCHVSDSSAADSGFETLITSGVSGALVLALLTCVGPGDEVLVPDPYFVMYSHLIGLVGAAPVYVDTYPDFQLTGQRIEPLITERTKMLLYSSPSNPTGVVTTDEACRRIVQLADEHNFLVLSDEIYNEFCYPQTGAGPQTNARVATPGAYSDRLILMRGFSKTYAMTGWRLGFAVGPAPIIEQMTKLQQYSFVCAPSMAQVAGVTALDQDMSGYIEVFRRRRDRVVDRLAGHFELVAPCGAFYAFPKVPEQLGLSGTQFVERVIERNLLIIPGNVFSNRDTHFRLSFACDDDMLDRGLDILIDLAS